MERDDLDAPHLIVRLAVAVMTADGQITSTERETLDEGLDELGLGRLSEFVEAEVQRAVHEPIDVVSTCKPLANAGPEAAEVILALLCEVAASDRSVTTAEVATLSSVATLLGLSDGDTARILRAAMEAYGAGLSLEQEESLASPQPVISPLPGNGVPVPADRVTRDPGLEQALRLLGLSAGADRRSVDSAYLDLVARYNPTKLVDLGADFVALAVRKLTAITDAFEYVIEGLRV